MDNEKRNVEKHIHLLLEDAYLGLEFSLKFNIFQEACLLLT